MSYRSLPPNEREEVANRIAESVGSKLSMTLLRITPTCVLCQNFNGDREICRLNGQRPPASVIAFGCEMYKGF
jgi:hypothetical protein